MREDAASELLVAHGNGGHAVRVVSLSRHSGAGEGAERKTK